MDPAARDHSYSGVASRATWWWSSTRSTTLGTRQWVCSWGSPSREVRCTNAATVHPAVRTRRRTWSIWRRASAARSSRNPSATATASSWAARHRFGGDRGGKGPQQRHALGGREGQVEGLDPPGPQLGHELVAGHRVAAVDQGSQRLGLNLPGHTETSTPAAIPGSGGLAETEVVLLDAERHRRDQVLAVGQRHHVQHGDPPLVPLRCTWSNGTPPPGREPSFAGDDIGGERVRWICWRGTGAGDGMSRVVICEPCIGLV